MKWKELFKPPLALRNHLRNLANRPQIENNSANNQSIENVQPNQVLAEQEAIDNAGAGDESEQAVDESEQAVDSQDVHPHTAHFDGPNVNIAYEDSNIRLLVRRTDFKTQKNHIMSDHLYTLIIQRKNPETEWPLATSILQGIYAALHTILEELKEHYGQKLKQTLDRYVYCTFNADGLESGINTGIHKLHDDTDDIVNEFRANVDNAMTSYKSMVLDSGFNVQVKVLGLEHMEEKKLRNGAIFDKVPSVHLENSFFLPVPQGFLNHPDAFKDRCLPLALILSAYELMYRTGQEPQVYRRAYLDMMKICNVSNNMKDHNTACTRLKLAFESLSRDYPALNHPEQDTTEISKAFADKFKVNVILHTNDVRDHIYAMYPPKYDESLPRIDVHGVPDVSAGTIHYAGIKALLAYKNNNNFGLACVFCKAVIKNHNNTHACKEHAR